MKRASYVITMIAALGLLISPAYADAQGKGHGKSHKHHGQKAGKAHGEAKAKGHRYFHDHGYTRLQIPPGFYSAPGQCRVWFPGRPPGHQPPPGDCWPVPQGAWVIRHPRSLPDDVYVYVYEPQDPRNLLVVGQFAIDSGLFVRVVLER